jgi:hypothetical protein
MYRAKHAGGNRYVFASDEGASPEFPGIEMDRILVSGAAVEEQIPHD